MAEIKCDSNQIQITSCRRGGWLPCSHLVSVVLRGGRRRRRRATRMTWLSHIPSPQAVAWKEPCTASGARRRQAQSRRREAGSWRAARAARPPACWACNGRCKGTRPASSCTKQSRGVCQGSLIGGGWIDAFACGKLGSEGGEPPPVIGSLPGGPS